MSNLATLTGSIARILNSLGDWLNYADASDFGFLAVAVIVTVWYVTRYVSE